MRKSLSIVFVLIIALNAMALSVVQLSFELNRDYIASFLCIEREKKITVCRGACFLKDKLKQAEEQQEQQNQTSQLAFVVFCTPSFWTYTLHTPDTPDILYSPFQEKLHTQTNIRLFFHPPRT